MTASYVTKRLHQISLWGIISQSTILTQEELKMHLAIFCLSQALLATLCPKSQRKLFHANNALILVGVSMTSSDTLSLTLQTK